MKTYAGIDLGSNATKIKIVQFDGTSISTLENLVVNLPLGDEVFKTGIIGRESLEEIISILFHFKSLLKMYDVKNCIAVATGAFRVSTNSNYVVDMIERKTGIKVEIIEDTVEKFLTYKSAKELLPNYSKYRKGGTVLVELTSYGSDVTILSKNKIIRNDEIGLGSQKLIDKLNSYRRETTLYLESLEIFIKTKMEYIVKIIKKKELTNFGILGGEIDFIKKMFFKDNLVASKKEFMALYKSILNKESFYSEKIYEAGIEWDEILVNLLFVKVFLELLNVDELIMPSLSLRDGLVSHLIDLDNPGLKRYEIFNEDPFSVTLRLAKRFGVSVSHIRYMASTTRKIMSAIADEYNFDENDKKIMRHSSYLYQIGKSINVNDYFNSSSTIIKGMRIYSLSKKDVNRISKIVSFLGLMQEGDISVYKKNLLTLRMAAILFLAYTLDASKRQAIKINNAYLSGEKLVIVYSSKDNIFVEKDLIKKAKTVFMEVFGISIVMRDKNV